MMAERNYKMQTIVLVSVVVGIIIGASISLIADRNSGQVIQPADSVRMAAPEWLAFASSPQDYIMQTGNNRFLWLTNGTGANITGDFIICVCRVDRLTQMSYTTAYIDSVGQITNTTSNMTYEIVQRCECGLYKITWSDGHTRPFNERIIMPYADGERTSCVTLSITLNPVAINQFEPYGIRDITFIAAGEIFTITVVNIAPLWGGA